MTNTIYKGYLVAPSHWRVWDIRANQPPSLLRGNLDRSAGRL